MRDHIITCVETVKRSHLECGVIITGGFNQLQDNFLRTQYRIVQVVEVVTRGQATLDKIWTNMVGAYTPPVTISEPWELQTIVWYCGNQNVVNMSI